MAMIEAAEREGRIEPGRTTIVEATSGNTGIALAFVCAAKGYDLVLTLPQGMSREREGAAAALRRATCEITESMGGMNEAVDAARALATRDDVFLPDQFSNPANPEIHRRTTGPEICEALDGRVDVFVAGVGTGGTITGVGEVPQGPQPRAAGSSRSSRAARRCSPGGAPGPHKIQGIGAGFVPDGARTASVLDEIIPVDDEDAIETARRWPRREGVLAGISCGAALWAALAGRRAGPSRGASGSSRPARLGRALRLDAVLRARAAEAGGPRPSVGAPPRPTPSIAGHGPIAGLDVDVAGAGRRSTGRPSGAAQSRSAPSPGQ